MKHIQKDLVTLLTGIVLFAIIMAGCTQNGNVLKLEHSNFTGEIATDQNLVFTFAENLVPDSLLNQWDSTAYLTFNPAVHGKFKWSAPNELTFSPSLPFAPSTDFEATLTDNLTKYVLNKPSLPKEKSLKFHTPYLLLSTAQVFYALSQQSAGAVEVRINLNFNCKVNPAELNKRLHLFVNEKEVPFNVLSGDADYSIGVSIADVRGDSKESMPLKIILEEGLPCVGSTYTTKEKMEFLSEIPVKEKIMITEMTASFIDGAGLVTVFTNQPIVNENLKSIITISPALTFTATLIDNGFNLKGDFEPGKTYDITISKELKGVFGYTLEENYSQTVSFGELEPALAFAGNNSIYLSSKGARNVGINIVNINKVKVSIIRIYENNILNFMRAGNEWGYYYEEEEGDNYEYHNYEYYDYNHYGDLVKEKVIDVQSLPKQGNMRLLNMNLEEVGYNDQFKGLYVVKVEDVDHQYLQESKFISLSDIGLIVRGSEDEVVVFANSIMTADPLTNVKVNFISTNNQTIQSVTTDSKGVAVLKNAKAILGKFHIGMITCTQGDDFNFMILDNTSVQTSRFEVGGKYSNDAHLDAFLYGDRDIYRPGDSIHVNAVIRTADWKIQKEVPMKIKLLLPSGKEYQSYKKTPDDQGAFETSFYLPTSIVTGLYTIELYTGNDVLIQSRSISVEEFVPDRIKVTTTLDKLTAKPKDEIKAEVVAANLFGPPAANRNYELQMTLNRKSFSAKKFNDYNFSITTGNEIFFENILRQGKTDNDGKAIEVFTIPEYNDVGVLAGKVITTVFDESGRPVNRLSEFSVNTQDVFYGIKYFDRWLSTKQPLSFQFVALNIAGQPVNATAQVEIYRYTWENVVTKQGGRYVYDAQRKDQLLSRQAINLAADGGKINFTPINSGEYEIRIHRAGATTFVQQNFYAYGWGDTQNTSFEVSTEGEVEMQTDKENYQPGDNAEILLKAPFNGKILVTVERDHVFDYFYVNTDKKAASISIPVKEEYLPNVYITATAIRKIADNQVPLTVARGYIPLQVEKTENKIAVNISANEKTRSKTNQTISVKTVPNAELTIAVVDEGILQLKNFKTPDPYQYFYQQRALEVRSYDLYPFLFPEWQTSYSSLGGDLAEMGKRVNPFTAKRFNLVALWSGILKADGNGNASFTVNVPQFSGALRVMAVAYKDNTFGASEKIIKVADPIVISTSLPRFLSPKDTISVPVTLTNTTAKNAQVTAQLAITGAMKIVGADQQSITIPANSEARVEFAVVTEPAIGVGSVAVNVSGLGEKFSDKTEISIRPPSTLTKISGNGMVKGGAAESVALKSNMIPATVAAKLIVSKSPLVQFSSDLRYLLQYPYGCIEQTVSAAFPQLYYRDLAKAIGQDKKAIRYNPDYNVNEAIKKIESMQLYNGAMSYWPGGDYESWWGTAYATHFLYEAKKAGFEVNGKILDKMYGYLQTKMKSREVEEYYYWDEQGIARSKTIVKREIPYSIFVLALAGKYDQTAMNYYKAHPELLSIDSKYLLSCAYALSGNQAAFTNLLPAAFSGEISKRAFGGSFYSPVRDEALALYVLMEVAPDNPQVGIMSRHLSEKLKNERWLSTQDRSFAFLALGKVAKRAQQSNVTAKVMVNGKEVGSFTGTDLVIAQGIADQSINIQAAGTGNLYYFWEQEGIPADGSYKQEDSYLKVRKTFYDRFGQPINGTSFKQNDLVVVKISLQALDYKTSVENVAVTDILPAGLEIENPRIGSIPELSWIKDAAGYDYLDVRDDRITFFTTATGTTKNYYYVVRAVSKGLFHMGPVSADA
ncbi:MAG: MG2 domain-containing protein, partial [Chitinophagales bacterium]